jgi:hypothetical protein
LTVVSSKKMEMAVTTDVSILHTLSRIVEPGERTSGNAVGKLVSCFMIHD